MPINMAEVLPPAKESVPITFRPIRLKDATGPESVGTNITLHTIPPTEIRVFPNSVTVRNGDFSLALKGPSKFRWGGERLIVDTSHDNGGSRLIVNQKGQVVFVHQIEAVIPVIPEGLLTDKIIKRRRGETADYSTLFIGVKVDEPETFESLTFGQTVRFLRVDAGISQVELAKRATLDLSTITRLENGIIKRVHSVDGLIGAFNWVEEDPRIRILKDAYDKEREKFILAMKARATKKRK